jgi:hypothetical protein
MGEVENWGECSKLSQHSRRQEHDKASDSRIRRSALIALQRSSFDFGFHDRTVGFSARKLRAIAASDVQISA